MRALVAAFDAVEDARTSATRRSPLTYFEFGTLAALWLFARATLDAHVLEVGLGGRLDAVNVVDADVAVVTSIDLDHVDYLGATREAIGREKAGIFRAGRPAICGDPDPPQSLVEHARRSARRCGASAATSTFVVRGHAMALSRPGRRALSALPLPALRGAYQLGNAAMALAALDALRDALPGRRGRDPRRARARRAAGPLPGAARAADDRARRRAQPARGARARRHARRHGLSSRRRSRCSACSPTRTSTASSRRCGRAIDRWYIAPLPGPRGASAARRRSRAAASRCRCCVDSRIRRHRTRVRRRARRGERD